MIGADLMLGDTAAGSNAAAFGAFIPTRTSLSKPSKRRFHITKSRFDIRKPHQKSCTNNDMRSISLGFL
jgi:hypothetical protein